VSNDGKLSLMMNDMIEVLVLGFLCSFAKRTQGSDSQPS
jgi:hypothetical protein